MYTYGWLRMVLINRQLSNNFDVQQGEEQVVPLKWVKEGQIIIVRPGEYVPVDGQSHFWGIVC